MSNITSLQIGQNKLEVPGKWINREKVLCEDTVIKSNTEYSLSDYLPDDDYLYEVQFDGWTNNRTRITAYTDKTTGTFVCLLYGSSGGSVGGNITLPVGKQRIVGLVGIDDQDGQIGLFRARRYRRLYKDDSNE